MAELLENESEVSDVDPEELANLIKGVDDMDDELFGFSSKKKQEVQKPKVEIKLKDEKGIKSKSILEDLPINDPLADISLSDDDFYDIAGSGNKPVAVTTIKPDVSKTENKLSDLPKVSPLKTTRAKKIADLFGLDDESVTKEEKKKSDSSSDWLGIKESPEKQNQDDFSKTVSKREEKNTSDIFPTYDSKETRLDRLDNVSSKKNVVFDIDGDREESFQARRRKSSTERVGKVQNQGEKENEDDVFGLLEDKGLQKTVETKIIVPRGILDDLLNETPVSRGRMSRQSSDEKKPKAESANLWDKQSQQATGGQYTPSLGGSRRPGFTRRRDTSPLSNQNTPPTSLKLMEDDWLTPSSHQESSKQNLEISREEKKPVKQQSFKSKESTADKLPAWLGGSSAGVSSQPSQRELLQDTGQKVSTETAQVVEVKHQAIKQNTEATPEALLTVSSVQSEQTAIALQRTEAQLLATLQLKQQRESMDAVCHRQAQLLEIQEQQLNSLVEQHIKKQTEVESKLHAQQERIGMLLQTLMTSDIQKSTINFPLQSLPIEVSKHNVNPDVVENKLQNEIVVAELEVELKKLKTENQDLKVRIEFLEKTHHHELATLSLAHQRDLDMWHEQEERFKACTKQIQEDYESRIHRLQENGTEQLRLEKERIERLQEERLSDLKQLGEFHRALFEQVSAINQILPHLRHSDVNTIATLKRPSDETQLTAREIALIQKEVELAAMQEKLSAQKENLDIKTVELEEKIEVERLKNEEMLRQLRREKRELNTKEQLWLKEQEHLKEQHENQTRCIEELRDNVVKEQTKLIEERLQLAEERARLEALSKLQGVAPYASFDIMQARAEVHGALEATRMVEMELSEERQRLREVQRSLELERWKLQEYDQDLAARAEHLDHVLQVSESNKEEGVKALEQAKKIHQTAEERIAEVEQRMKDVLDKEQKLIKEKVEFTHEEMRLKKRREQLDQILPELSAAESLSLQPVSKSVIDPKMLIMKLKAEKELDSLCR